jgi:hypothetical protein
MRSVLTRLLFRRILHNEPILHRDCIYRPAQVIWHHHKRIPTGHQRRTLFGFSRPSAKEPRDTDLNPGLNIIVDASKNLETKTRVPPPEELAAAWSAFFKAKAEREELFSDIHADHAYRVYLYLRDLQADVPFLHFDALRSAFKALTNQPQLAALTRHNNGTWRQEYLEFVRELYVKLGLEDHPGLRGSDSLRRMIRSLTSFGHLTEAVDLYLSKAASFIKPEDGRIKTFRELVDRCKEENNVQSLDAILKGISSWELDDRVSYDWAGAIAFAQMGQMDRARGMVKMEELGEYARQASLDSASSSTRTKFRQTLRNLLDSCLTHKDLEWGHSLIRVVTEAGFLSKDRRMWDILFSWALATGKSIEEVHRMMEVMERTIPEFKTNPDTINRLLRVAIQKNDAYLAERLIALGKRWNVEANADTLMLQMDYRLSNGDLEGARAAYRQLQGQELDGDDDLPRINKLIQAMASSGKYDFDTIIGIVEELSTRNHRFDPETVAVLSVLHLNRDEYHDVADLLTTHVHQYTAEERAIVRDTFAAFCLDRRNSIARVWDTYMIFQQVFDESDREVRTRIMNEFFTRRRADMAVHVFNHMRKHTRPDTFPTTETYAAALVGIGKLSDMESLTVVHNALKLDMNVEPSTKMNNALMIAYTGCGEPRYAINFWIDIASSKEGPNYNSILALFNACEKAAFGEKRAISVWNQLGELDVVMTRDLVAKYLAALAGNQCFDDAKKIAEECEQRFGFEADATM